MVWTAQRSHSIFSCIRYVDKTHRKNNVGVIRKIPPKLNREEAVIA
jgi:hypothetical protein